MQDPEEALALRTLLALEMPPADELVLQLIDEFTASGLPRRTRDIDHEAYIRWPNDDIFEQERETQISLKRLKAAGLIDCDSEGEWYRVPVD